MTAIRRKTFLLLSIVLLGAKSESCRIFASANVNGSADEASSTEPPQEEDELDKALKSDAYLRAFGPDGYLTKGGEVDRNGDGIPDDFYEIHGDTRIKRTFTTDENGNRCMTFYSEITKSNDHEMEYTYSDYDCDGRPESIKQHESQSDESVFPPVSATTVWHKDKNSDGIFESRTTVVTKGLSRRKIEEKGYVGPNGEQTFKLVDDKEIGLGDPFQSLGDRIGD